MDPSELNLLLIDQIFAAAITTNLLTKADLSIRYLHVLRRLR